MSDPTNPDKNEPTGETKDELLQTGPEGAVELTDDQLDAVSGGKAKTADKAFNAMDGYIRG